MLWLKAFHIIAVVTWFAALFYLPRLFVYHAMAEDQISKDRFKIMERKLYRGIMTPSMIIVLGLGVWMITLNAGYYLSQGWMHAKLALVVFLVGYHFMCGSLLKKFTQDINDKGHVFYRWFNEVPVLFLIAIIILVVVRPF
ncbi:MAG: putative membrane protein [Oleispira sp.]|jgi:putative membrane protein